ncbi:MAG: SIMPL domain-containing protein [Candidatus Pacebacteria bacterium]|nr:SIMPL domain-containing protein [Candidatus Paceibacterota bacterium]
METTKNNKLIFISTAVIIFSVLLSAAIFLSAQDFSKQGSYVEVKGLSEKIVKADIAIWSLSFEVKSNNIDTLYGDIEKNITTIKSFLTEKGFEASEINIAPVNIYQDTYKAAAFRYNATNQVSVYTKKVDLAKATSNETLLLVKNGVVLNQNYISFEFSDINSIKPEMLADAIKNAKDTASQFALNSGSLVGSVTRGNQGVFDITDKDPGSPEYKKIRLVSTLRFLLK